MPTWTLFVAHGCTQMGRAPEDWDQVRLSPNGPNVSSESMALSHPERRVLVIDADSALFGLIEEWLVALGYSVIAVSADNEFMAGAVDLVIIDIPFPRRGRDQLQRIATDYPQTPILALSSTFFTGVENSSAVARALGVAGVLPKPVRHGALIAAVTKLAPAPTKAGLR